MHWEGMEFCAGLNWNWEYMNLGMGLTNVMSRLINYLSWLGQDYNASYGILSQIANQLSYQ